MADATQPYPQQPEPYQPGPPRDPFLDEDPATGPTGGADGGDSEPATGDDPSRATWPDVPGYPAPGHPAAEPAGGYPAPPPPGGYGAPTPYPPGHSGPAPYPAAPGGYPTSPPGPAGHPAPPYPPEPSGRPVSAYPVPGYPTPSGHSAGVVITTIGEIQVTATTVRTPAGELPLRGSQWTVTDQWMRREKIPTWAIVAAIAGFCVLTVFSLLFLLARESVYEGVVQVSVSNGPRQYVARIPVNDQMQVQHIHNQVNYARSLGSV